MSERPGRLWHLPYVTVLRDGLRYALTVPHMKPPRSTSAAMLAAFASRMSEGQRVVTAFIDACVDAGFDLEVAVSHVASRLSAGSQSVACWLAPLISADALVLVTAGEIEGDLARYVALAADVECPRRPLIAV